MQILSYLSKTQTYLISLVVILCGPNLWAGSKPGLSIRDQAPAFSAHCQNDLCDFPYTMRLLRKIGATMQNQLGDVAYSQAQIWGDTILEGDYEVDGPVTLDSVRILRVQNKKIGYLITYSQRAWDTSTCAYDGYHHSTLEDCLLGRIVESSYVSLDLKDYFYDEKTSAVFVREK